VALLTPIPNASPIERLAASGRLVEAAGDALELGAPLEPVEGAALPSSALAEARADER
jgi:hypothetical protein